LLKSRDADGLRSLLEVARGLDDGGSLASRIGYDLSFLEYHGAGPVRPGSFWFGDPRRPRSLAFALLGAIVTFPLLWAGFFVVMALGEPEDTRHAERVVVVLAAIGPVLGFVAAAVTWSLAWRTYAPEERVPLRRREGALWSATVLVVAGAGASLGVLLWNTYL
jgi:hypothetical protein